MEIREGHNKFYINDEQGKQIAEIVFVPTGENLAIIEHTDIDESLKGQRIGKTAGCRKSWKNASGKNEKLSHYAHLRNTNLIKYGSMMIFAVER
ncbi:N-acetyltransferase [Escherichia coli]|nr:N-acetyltransferase [Escherichia coli]